MRSSIGSALDVAQASEPAVSQVSNLRKLARCRMTSRLEVGDTAGSEACATGSAHVRAPQSRAILIKRHAGTAGFTLAEVLAALLFMAIVIPVAVQGLQIASRAGEVAQRKGEAARVAERILNESVVTTNYSGSSQSGTVFEGLREFRWTLHSEQWSQGTTNQVLPGQSAAGQVNNVQPIVDQFAASQIPMSLLTVEVTYPVQGRDYNVTLSTLVPAQ